MKMKRIPWNKGKKGLQVAWNKGKKGIHLSPKTEFKKGTHPSPRTEFKKGQNIGVNNINYGRKRSDETKRKISEANRGKKNPNYGTHFSEEHRRKISESNKLHAYWRGKATWNTGKKGCFSKETRLKMRKARLTRVFPRNDTKIERMMQDELSARGYAYRKHYPIIGQPDLAFPNKKIAIFVDGCYWHKCHVCGHGNGREVDRQITKELQTEGWLVLRIWEHDIKKDVKRCVDEIESTLM